MNVLDVVHAVVLRNRWIVVVGVVSRHQHAAVAVLAKLPESLQPLVSPRTEVRQRAEQYQAGGHQQERRH